MGVVEKIKELEEEVAKTQKNKATEWVSLRFLLHDNMY